MRGAHWNGYLVIPQNPALGRRILVAVGQLSVSASRQRHAVLRRPSCPPMGAVAPRSFRQDP
jgi:hypothetical protein